MIDRGAAVQTKTRTHQGARNLHSSRRDPRPRSTFGTPNVYEVVNKDPRRKYVLASEKDSDTGVAYYESLGYEIEPYRGPDAPHLRACGPRTANESVQRYRECVLMSIDKEIADEDDLNGQKHGDAKERQIRGRVGLLEGEARLFGRGGAVAVELQSEASPEQSELVQE